VRARRSRRGTRRPICRSGGAPEESSSTHPKPRPYRSDQRPLPVRRRRNLRISSVSRASRSPADSAPRGRGAHGLGDDVRGLRRAGRRPLQATRTPWPGSRDPRPGLRGLVEHHEGSDDPVPRDPPPLPDGCGLDAPVLAVPRSELRSILPARRTASEPTRIDISNFRRSGPRESERRSIGPISAQARRCRYVPCTGTTVRGCTRPTRLAQVVALRRDPIRKGPRGCLPARRPEPRELVEHGADGDLIAGNRTRGVNDDVSRKNPHVGVGAPRDPAHAEFTSPWDPPQ